MIGIGPQLGVSSHVSADVMKELHKIYQTYNKREIALRNKASEAAEAFQRKLLEQRPKEQGGEAGEANPTT